MKYHNHILIITVCFLLAFPARSEIKNYLRDYQHTATPYDTQFTSRIRAIDGIKQELVNELGIYVESIIKINEDSLGKTHMSQDITTLAAGIVSMKVLKEDWNNIRFYIKASMKADPNEVLNTVKKLQKNHELEKILRSSVDNLNLARKEIKKLRSEIQSSQNSQNNIKTASSYQSAIQKLAAEQKFQEAMQAYIRGDFNTMITIMTELANSGFASAQARLGWFYERGMGVKEDFNLAKNWYEKASKKNNGFALARIGFMYERGLGVIQNYFQAAKYYNKSVELDHPVGHAHLGYAYMIGAGVEKNHDIAFQHLSLSAKKGSSLGMAWLTICYLQGIGTEQDNEKAIQLIKKSTEYSNPLGLAMLGNMYLKGNAVDQNFDTALKYIRASAERGNPFGYSLLGFMYENGLAGLNSDKDKAVKFYKKSAAQKNDFGQLRLARAYWNGIGVSKDRKMAKKIVKQVADKGLPKGKRTAKSFLKIMSNKPYWPWHDKYLEN